MNEPFATTDRIRTAVVTGQHPFDVPSFHECFSALDPIAYYPQHMEDFCATPPELRDLYDAVVFYHFHQATPTGEGPWYEAGIKAALEHVGETEQGIVILHHAILAFPEWDFWADLVGIQDRAFSYFIGETIVIVFAADHPITAGLSSWTQVEETYKMASCGDDSTALLTTDNEKSMRTLAWTRTVGKARVFCLELGHDASAFNDSNFRTVLGRGIEWVSRRI